MTIKDVAAHAGVAVSTVSRVLNNHPDVSAATRTKVMEAIRKLNYVPNNTARDLVAPQTDSIGVVVRGAENPFYTPIIHAIESVCEANGYTMVLHQIPVGAAEVVAAAELVRSKRLRGVILLGGRFDYTKEEGTSIGVPFVCCTNTNEFGDLTKDSFSSVSIDDIAEGKRATRMLVDHGHTKIALVIDSESDHSISQLRLDGYCQALQEAGIPFDPDLVVQTIDFTMGAAYEHMSALLDRRQDFTAVFCVADSMAIAVMKALHDHGRRVPEDVSVIAIDGIDMSLYTTPTLTTLCQPQRRLGTEAVEVLLGVLNGTSGNRHIRIDTELRPGGTVAQAR